MPLHEEEIKEKKVAVDYQDRRSQMTIQQIQQADEIFEIVLNKYPDVKDHHYNLLGRFITGYKYEQQEVIQRFSAFYDWAKQVDFFNKKLDQYPELQNLKYIFIVNKLKSGYSQIVLKLCNFKFDNINKDDFVIFSGLTVFECVSLSDPKLDQYLMIIDLDGASKDNINMDFIKSLMPILGNYFPDVCYKMYIINAGFLLKTLFKAASSMIHPVTREKIKMLGTNQKEIKETLLKEMDISELPKKFGGNLNFDV